MTDFDFQIGIRLDSYKDALFGESPTTPAQNLIAVGTRHLNFYLGAP